eukprot:COSAG06_NODE_3141_length_5786_cov_31.010902_1_plen_434_part_00
MDAPLVVLDGQQQQPPDGGHSPDDNEQSAQVLPLELRNKLRRYMTVGGVLLDKRQRAAFTHGRACWWMCMGYVLFRSLDAVENGRFAASVVAGVYCTFAVGIIVVVLPFYRDVIPYVDAQLDAPVGPAAAATLTKALQGFGAQVAVGIVLLGGIITVVVYHMESSSIADHVLSIATVALIPPATTMAVARALIYDTAFLLAEDRVRQLAAEVRRTPAASADFNALAKGVFRAHADTEQLSSLMQTHVLFAVANLSLSAMAVLLIAIGPRPPLDPSASWHEQHWFNIVLHPAICAVLVTYTSCQGIWALSTPTRVTSACQQVASAVNDMRLTAHPDGDVTLAEPEQLHRIEGLKRYINELNRDQGLGFILLRKRVTFTLVVGLMIQTVSGMIVLNGFLLSLTKVEGEEEQAITEEEAIEHVLEKGRRLLDGAEY